MSIWKYIKADTFFADYLPHIKSHKFKIRGSNSRNNPTEFSTDEKKQIVEIYDEEKYNRMLEILQEPNAVKQTRKTVIPNFLHQAIDELTKVLI